MVNVARSRGHLFVCSDACCCGWTEDGIPPVPADLYHAESMLNAGAILPPPEPLAALNEDQCYPWDDFRDRLIAQIADADARNDPSGYCERWLAAFEQLLDENGIISKDELDERTFAIEFGERDDVY